MKTLLIYSKPPRRRPLLSVRFTCLVVCVCIIFEIITHHQTVNVQKMVMGVPPGAYTSSIEREKRKKKLKFSVTVPSIPLGEYIQPARAECPTLNYIYLTKK